MKPKNSKVMKKLILSIFIFSIASINVFAQAPCQTVLTSAVGTDSQQSCKSVAITDITYQISGTNASVTGLPKGVSGSYNANVYTIAGTPNEAGLPAKTFSYTLVVTGGCSPDAITIGSITVNAPDNETMFSYNNTPFCKNSPSDSKPSFPIPIMPPSPRAGVFSVSPSGLVLNDSTGEINLAVSAPGSYIVTNSIAAANGCPAGSSTTNVTINNSLPLTVNNKTICSNETVILLATGADSYKWSNGATTDNISVTPTKTTSYSVTGTTGSCSNTVVGTITIFEIFANSVNICSGANGTLTASGGADSYLWSNGNTTNSITVSPTTPTSYSVTGTKGNCSSSKVVNVGFEPVTLNQLTANNATICSGGTALLAANGADSFLWSNGSMTDSISVNPTTTTSYTVVGTKGKCNYKDSVVATVTVANSISVTVNSATITSGNSATLTANGATTYTWAPIGLIGNSITVSTTTTTTYTVTGTSGSCTSSDVAIVTVDAITYANDSIYLTSATGTDNQTVCNNSQITNITYKIPGTNSSVAVNGLPSGINYFYNSSVLTISGTPNTVNAVTNTYTVIAIGTGINDSIVYGSIKISSNNGSAFSYANSYCQNSANPLPTIPSNKTGVFSEQTGGLKFIDSTTGEINLAGSTPGTYTVTSNIGGCSSNSSQITVSINPTTPISVNSETVCAGTWVTLIANGAAHYTWSDGSIGQYKSYNAMQTESYTVQATGCSTYAVAKVTLTSGSIPAAVNNASTCAGTPTTLTASGAGTYMWSDGSTTNSITVNPPTSTTYTVQVTNGGCTSQAVANVYFINAVLSMDNVTICAGNSATLIAHGATTYTWSNGTQSDTLFVTPKSTTSYTVNGSDGVCTGSAVGTVYIGTATAVNSLSICAGNSVTLTASGADSYIWSTGETIKSIFVSPNKTTSYNVKGKGCASSATANVIVNNGPKLVESNVKICRGDKATLVVNGNSSQYVWSESGYTSTNNIQIVNTTSIQVSPDSTTIYSVYDAMGQCRSYDTVTVNSCTPSGKPLSITVISTDASTFSSCNGSATATIKGGTLPYTLKFAGNTYTDSIKTIGNLCAGFYTAQVTDAKSKSASFTFVVGSPTTVHNATDSTYADSTIAGTLVTNAISNCVINYDAIDSIAITNHNFVGTDSINVTWTIYQGSNTNTQKAMYAYPKAGVYNFVLDVYCASRASGSVKGIDQLYLDITSGIETIETTNVSVYPNPFSNNVNMVVDKASTIKITDVIGSVICSGTVNAGTNTIETGSFSSGVYFITISNNTGSVTKKMIKNQ
jgi:hypothetical protein